MFTSRYMFFCVVPNQEFLYAESPEIGPLLGPYFEPWYKINNIELWSRFGLYFQQIAVPGP